MALAASDAAADLASTGDAEVRGSLTLSGRPEHVSEARAFVAKVLGASPLADTVVLLTSELVTNAVMHSRSQLTGGSVSVLLADVADGIRVAVTDDGSDLSTPDVRVNAYSCQGHGLLLVQNLSDQWGYARGAAGTTVWFWLGDPPR